MSAGGTVVSHTETYGVGVTGSNPFELTSTWAVQPGIRSYSEGTPLGTWLPQIAGNFDNYEIMKLKFHFRTACSTLEKGIVMMAYEPNPDGAPPTSYQDVRNMHSVDGTVHSNLAFDVTPRLRGKKLLTRRGTVYSLPNYDAGKVYLATIGCTDDVILGFVDVEYVVRLTNPQSGNSTTNSIPPTFPTPVSVLRWDLNNISSTNSDDVGVDKGLYPFSRGINVGTNYGASLFTSVTASFPIDTAWGGDRFKNDSTAINCLSVTNAGRYRIAVHLPYDFQDLKLFTVCPFVRRGVVTSVAQRASAKAVGSAEYTLVDCMPFALRGFAGVATGDPNPATDMPAVGSWEVQCAAGDLLMVCIGIRTYNISPLNATVKYASGLGAAWFQAEFLGNPVLIT
jgi:hypothetical protein